MHNSHRGFTLTDALVSVALLAVGSGVAIATIQETSEADNRLACARNLRQIGQAMRQYAIDDIRRASYPRTLYDVQRADKPAVGTPYAADGAPGAIPEANAPSFPGSRWADQNEQYVPKANDVTAAFYHLMRETDTTSEHFVCPSTEQTPLAGYDGFTEMAFSNWPGRNALRSHLSYSFQNPYFSTDAIVRGAKWTDALGPRYVLAADLNPGHASLLDLGERPADGDPATRGAPRMPGEPDIVVIPGEMPARDYNSHNHGGEGQNVLYSDGAVFWETNPFNGFGDNIYTYRIEDDASAGFVGSASGPNDNILLPTADMLTNEGK